MDRKNNFGFLRLLFATLVIVSHSAEIIDGNRSREALTSLFGVLTFGELSVDAFFLISGYLIVQSFETSRSIGSYLEKRVRRIYPGFLAAFFVCLLVVAPLGGTDITLKTTNEWAAAIFGAMFLHGPSWSSFVGLPIPALNGSMWSIPVEFNCYLLVIVLGNLGFYKRKWPLLILTVLLLMATELKFDFWLPRPANWLIGDRYLLFRCFGMFCVGSLYYIQRDRILFSSRLAALAAAALVFFLSQSILAEAAFAVLGGYLIFWAALHVNSPVLQRINSNQDISYGVYLYAWPMQSLLVYYFHLRSPALLLLVTIPLTYCIGYASWRVIESPLKNFKRAKKNLVKSSSD